MNEKQDKRQEQTSRELIGIRRRELGVSRWKESAGLPFVFFHFCPRQTPLRSPFQQTFLSCRYVLQKYNCGGRKE